MLYDHLSDLSVEIEGYDLHRNERETSSGFTRVTTTVSLHGEDETGHGEDVTYDANEHDTFHRASSLSITGQFTLTEFSDMIGDLDLFFGSRPEQSVFWNYRRWAFESAALDLGLKQTGVNLAERLNRECDPVRFVVSTRLGDPPTGDRILNWLERDSSLEFKLDPTSDWTDETVSLLANTNAVRVLDLKGQYHGTTVDQSADPDLYRRIIDGFPEALIEDPALTETTRPLFEGHEGRVTWDYPIRSVETVERLPWEPAWINIKPSRFGSVQALFDTIEYCLNNGIQMFGGGQFELGVGRGHLHALASLFYPDAPNDIALKEYNDPTPSSGLPSSPLVPPSEQQGFSWK
ncbi:hypothetical protein K0C01_10230 [Salinarchaeum sp. IM2453]|uniref:hypothetical protein n=1 Tax=Salinarchaeum sp. IM2453 TaxID=2862870 RepID=UPI001C83426E|nr:hypothetical protein [Salinarchaeum sp. IM2453]QZA88161.1 hypothetical protein K0C01_10230 [Salinarchaeum sp. IM2453]